jgi:hypothetical protein
MGLPSIYPTYASDPYEPNQPPAPVDPQTSTDPRRDFRAFVPYGLKDRFTSGGGWYHATRALLGQPGDEDYYFFTNSYTYFNFNAAVPSKLNLDATLYVYQQNAGAWQYKCQVEALNATSGTVSYHPVTASGNCPAGLSGPLGFLVRVKGHDPAVDFGPWPYLVSFPWG